MKTPEELIELLETLAECEPNTGCQRCDECRSAIDYVKQLSQSHDEEMEAFVKWYESNWFSVQTDGRHISLFYTDSNGKSHKSYTFPELLAEFRKNRQPMKNIKNKCQFCEHYDTDACDPCSLCIGDCRLQYVVPEQHLDIPIKWKLHHEIESALQQAFEAGVEGSIESACNHKILPTFKDYRKEAML